ncbi:MAG: LLM class flavin-dependent oxidoreductase [Chloroflexota bacterium]|nr:LLM class flavin-dependent oxidoreductase [Chloroflexota bacterium]
MSPLRFGWRFPTWPTDAGTPMPTFQAQVDEHLRALDGLFDSVWVSDHLAPDTPWAHPSGPLWEGMMALAYYAAAFPNYDYGTITLANSYRPPALLAKMVSTLQSLMRGRLTLGIGAGWKKEEYLAYGYPFPSAGLRIDQLDEAVQLIRAMWTQSPATWHGNYFQVTDAYSNPRPDPPIEILIGGGGEQKTLRVVARHADWWNLPGQTPADFARKTQILRGYCREIGRDPDGIGLSWDVAGVAVAATHEAAVLMAEADPFHQPGISPMGTPEEVAAHLQQYVDLGVQLFMLRFADFPDTTGAVRFTQQVIPLLRS